MTQLSENPDFSLKSMVEIHGEENLLLKCPMPNSGIGSSMLGIFLTDGDNKSVQLCQFINDSNEPIYDHYRIRVRSIETGFTERFYRSDLESLIREGVFSIEVKPAFFQIPTEVETFKKLLDKVDLVC